MIVKDSAWVNLLQPGLARMFFYGYYPQRRHGQSRKTYRNMRRRLFKKWIAQLPEPEDDEF